MNLRFLYSVAAALAISSVPMKAAVLWVVGVDDTGYNFEPANPGNGGGANATFVQENGTTNALPGNPANAEVNGQGDNDYYFAGSYTTVISTNGSYTPVGTVAANEESVERAFAGSDQALRYHFNVPATFGPNDRVSVSFDAMSLQGAGGAVTDPRWGVEIYINGVLVRPEQVIRPAQFNVDYTSDPKKLSEVGIVTGPGADNIVTLKGISYNGSGGGNWMGIDYVKVDIDNSPLIVNTFTASPVSSVPGAPVTLAWTLEQPGAVVSINQGVGTVTGASVTVNPIATTTYTLTATFGGNTQTKTATVTVSPLISSFTTSAPLIIPGNSATLSWTIPAAASAAVLSIDQGVGTVTATAGTGSVVVSPAATTTYTLTVTYLGVTQTATTTVNVGEWQVGIDDNIWNYTAAAPGNGGGRFATFVQETGAQSALPGNKANAEFDQQADNDYYFAGSYTTVIPANGTYTPVGTVAANEESVERAFGVNDISMRYHFNVPAGYTSNSRVSVSFDSLNLDTSATNADPRWGVEVYINGTLVRPEEIIRPAQFDTDYTSAPKKFSEVGLVTGPGADNIVTLKGIPYNASGGGAWMGIDYMKVSFDNTPLLVNTFTSNDYVLRPGDAAPTLSWSLAEPTATVVIDQGVGNVTGLTTAGNGSVVVNPSVTTTYTITATLGGQTQSLPVTIVVTPWSAIFEAGTDNGSSAEFSHEVAADDNFYYAGDYTAAGGPNQAVTELLNDDTDTNTVAGRTGNAAIGFERSLTDLDTTKNVWFIANPAMITPGSRIRVTADLVSSSGVNALEFSINGNVVHTRTGISGPMLVQQEFSLLSSYLVAGPNVFSIKRIGTTLGGSVTFDQVALERMAGSLPTVTGITHDGILGTHTVNWTSVAGRTYQVEKSTDSGATWVQMIQGFPMGGAKGSSLFYEDRVTPWTDPVPQYRVLEE